MLETLEELESSLKSPGTVAAVHVQRPITSLQCLSPILQFNRTPCDDANTLC